MLQETYKIEVKLRKQNEPLSKISWEDIQPIIIMDSHKVNMDLACEFANTVCENVINNTPNISEIRWNFKGIEQGHYLHKF